jgi:hypothetical protein
MNMEWNKNKIPDNQLIKNFINDLRINAGCRKSVKYGENKGQEWALLKQALKTKTVIPVVTVK